jgi:hypothetical protein
MSSLELEPVGREVVHPVTGELLDLASESVERLAELTVDLQADRTNLNAFELAVSDALVDRLDRSAQWTLRVGDPTGDRQYEVKAPSPTAGTTAYLDDVLESELQTLVIAGTITPDAASNACKRHLVLTLAAPWGVRLQDLADSVTAPETVIEIGGVTVDVVKADASVKAATAGINALRKVPGTSDALDAATTSQPAPPRRARVTVKGRGA